MPTSFELSGPIVIRHSTSSSIGEPRLSYADAERSLSFAGTEITRVPVLGGEVVTVTLARAPLPAHS